MKDLFKAVQNKIITAVAAVKMVDFDLGQLEQEPLPPLDYPAVLISFGESTFVDLGTESQNGTVQLVLRVAFRTYERTHSIAAQQYRDIGLSHLDTLDAIKWALHGFEGTGFNKLSHRVFATEPRADLRVYQLQFETLTTTNKPTPQYVLWGQAGGQGDNPNLCLTDEDNNAIT